MSNNFAINYTYNETKVQFAQGSHLDIFDYTPLDVYNAFLRSHNQFVTTTYLNTNHKDSLHILQHLTIIDLTLQ